MYMYMYMYMYMCPGGIFVTGDRFENLRRRGVVSGNAKIWAVWVDFGITVTPSFVNRSH